MPDPNKFAYISTITTGTQHRFVSGVARYVDAHPPIIFRDFYPAKNLVAAAIELEKWGATGILAHLEPHELAEFIGALKHPIPVVSNVLTNVFPSVLTVLTDAQAFFESAINHFREIGLRSAAFLYTDDGPQSRHLADTFLRITNPPSSSRNSTLLFTPDPEKLYDPNLPVAPVPAVLADWLHTLPKPTGILSTMMAAGHYLVHCCQALGLRVPEDVAIICADEPELCLTCSPTVTSIVPANESMGFEAARLLQEFVEGKRQGGTIVRFRHFKLNVRESTGQRKPEICDIPGALHYIQDNACKGVTVKEVIKATQRVSPATFHRRFQVAVGKTPADIIRDRKLDEVRRLLSSTNLSMEMVAYLSGFSSAAVLARNFRAVEGISLSEYRRTHKISTA